MSETQTIGSKFGAVQGLTTFQQNILVIPAKESTYGLVIKRHFESHYDTGANRGCLYPNLDDLAEMDLTEKSELGKRTNQYELTDDGLRAVLDRFGWILTKFATDDEHAETVSEFIESKL